MSGSSSKFAVNVDVQIYVRRSQADPADPLRGEGEHEGDDPAQRLPTGHQGQTLRDIIDTVKSLVLVV